MTPRALDLFCGAGGVTKGLQRAGFHVTGVDLVASPRYCGDAFVRGDALDVPLTGYAFVWASPPCQRYSLFSRNLGTARNHPDLVGVIRDRLVDAAIPFAIENVAGAPLMARVVLCGTMFGLPLIRHRLIETSFTVARLLPPCRHTGREIPVYGNGTPTWHRDRLGRGVTVAEKRAAMGIDWMTRDELSQAIPPAFAEFVGQEALNAIRGEP